MLSVFSSGCIFEDPITTEAIQKKNPELCKDLKDESEQQHCFQKVAEAAGDTEICDKYLTGKNKDSCYSDVGGKTKDESVCEKVKDDSTETEVHQYIINKNAYWIFGLEYTEIQSKVSFPLKKRDYEFDLMLKRFDNFLDLVELKGPNESLFDKRTEKKKQT